MDKKKIARDVLIRLPITFPVCLLAHVYVWHEPLRWEDVIALLVACVIILTLLGVGKQWWNLRRRPKTNP
jgi:hypothetical protein